MRKISWLIIGLCLLGSLGCQNTESPSKQWSLFGQKSETPTNIKQIYYIFNGPGTKGLVPASQPYAEQPDGTVITDHTFGKGDKASTNSPGGRYVQVINLNADVGTTNTQTPTGTQNGTQTNSNTPTQTTETKAGLALSAQLQGAGMQQSNPSGSGEGASSSAGAPQSLPFTPSVNVGSRPSN